MEPRHFRKNRKIPQAVIVATTERGSSERGLTAVLQLNAVGYHTKRLA
jgi:hypothetical protein